jgi:hypothetical protein
VPRLPQVEGIRGEHRTVHSGTLQENVTIVDHDHTVEIASASRIEMRSSGD